MPLNPTNQTSIDIQYILRYYMMYDYLFNGISTFVGYLMPKPFL